MQLINKISAFILISFIFFYSHPVFGFKPSAKNSKTQEIPISLEEQIKKIKSFDHLSANFSQTRSVQKNGLKERISNTQGEFKLSRKSDPIKFLWSVQSQGKGSKQLLELYVSDGVSLWNFNKLTNHVQKMSRGEVGLAFVEIFNNLSSIEKHYQVEQWTENEVKDSRKVNRELPSHPLTDSLFLKLTPLSETNLSVIYCHVLKDKGVVKELRLMSRDGSRTQITFSDFNFAKISDDVFKFTPPVGAQNGK